MEARIWRNLPRELLERILSLLPLNTFLSLRCTCKYFRSLIFSPTFISTHRKTISSSFLLLSHPQSTHYLLYDTALNTWRNFNLRAPLLSTSAALFCFSSSSSYSFLIYNLLAGGSTRTIQFPEHASPFLFPTLVAESRGYKLFCLSDSSSYAHLYDSRLSCWIRYPAFHRILGGTGVFVDDGRLYFATGHPFSVVGFDLETGSWETREVGVGEELTFVRLCGGGGRLFMFGGIGRNGISRSMKVWEWEKREGQGKWVEAGLVPEMMCRKLGSVCYHNYQHVYCFWHGETETMWACCYTWPEVLYYRMSRRTWHWLPKCPSLPHKWCCGFKWFSFAPQLSAFV